jgi:hypothetical protein
MKLEESEHYRYTQAEVDEVLISILLELFFVGFEIPSSGMALCCYYLAKNPGILW